MCFTRCPLDISSLTRGFLLLSNCRCPAARERLQGSSIWISEVMSLTMTTMMIIMLKKRMLKKTMLMKKRIMQGGAQCSAGRGRSLVTVLVTLGHHIGHLGHLGRHLGHHIGHHLVSSTNTLCRSMHCVPLKLVKFPDYHECSKK